MIGRNIFTELRRVGMGVGVSNKKVADSMLAILLQLPTGTTDLKETIIHNLGMLGEMASTRELELAWSQTKKKAAKLHPDKFILGPRNILSWNDGTTKILDKNISLANFKKLNELADAAGCNVNAIVTQLIKAYKQKDGR